MGLDLSNFNAEVKARGAKDSLFSRMSLMFESIQEHVNRIAGMVGVDSSGHTQPPDAPTAINVKAAGGIAHVTIQDNNQRSRALNYFVEHDTDPSFPAPHVAHLVASRGTFLSLPAKGDSGSAQSWYFRAYSMYPGSQQRSAHQVFGGATAPTAVDVGGTTQLTPLASQGSGTASTTGQQGGTGFGMSQFAKS